MKKHIRARRLTTDDFVVTPVNRTNDKNYSDINQSSHSYSLEYYNFTGKSIRTLDHLGLCVFHQPILKQPPRAEFAGKFVIRRRYTSTKNNPTFDYSKSVDGRNHELNTDSEITKLIINELNGSDGGLMDSIHYFAISDSVLERYGGIHYLRDLNIVLASESFHDEMVHPLSNNAIDQALDTINESSFTYSIMINDPQSNGQPYYINLNGQVFELQPTKDVNLGNVVKLNWKKPNRSVESIYVGTTNDIDLNKYGLFKSYQEADNYGQRLELLRQQIDLDILKGKAELENNKLNSTRETLEIKLESERQTSALKIAELSAKLEENRIKFEQAMRARDIENENLRRDNDYAYERHIRDIENMRMKDYYDQRSHERKDSSEFVKWLPTIIGAGLAAWGILM